MKLALYLPNFREKVTVKELKDLTALAEELEFDSVWTLDRIIVPEVSDRQELQYSFGKMEEFPKALPVSSRGEWFQGWPLIPWLAAKTKKCRIGMSVTDTPFRAPGVMAAEIATVDHLSGGRVNVGLGSGWMPEEFAGHQRRAHLREAAQARTQTIEIMQGSSGSATTRSRCPSGCSSSSPASGTSPPRPRPHRTPPSRPLRRAAQRVRSRCAPPPGPVRDGGAGDGARRDGPDRLPSPARGRTRRSASSGVRLRGGGARERRPGRARGGRAPAFPGWPPTTRRR